MSADTPPGDTPKVGDALVAALGFEPTDGVPAAAEEGNGAARSVFATTTADVLESASPPKGTLFGTETANGTTGNDEPTAESPSINEVGPAVTADGHVADEVEPVAEDHGILDEPGVIEDLDSALGDLDVDDEGGQAADEVGGTVVAESGAGETIRIPSPPQDLFDADSSGVHPVEVPPSPVPGGPVPAGEFVNGSVAESETMVAPSSSPTGDVLDAGVPTAPPLAEQPPIPQEMPATTGSPLTVDEALGGGAAGALAGGTIAARQAGTETSIGDRVTGAASRLPQLFEDGFRQRPRRVRARKVRRVIRHVDPWSMLTFSVLFHLCVFAALLLASVLVWNAATAAGTIENIEDFIRDLGDYKTYEINGDVVFRAAMVIAGILTLASSLLVVLLTVVFNLISDLVGGIRVTVIEEETVRVRRRSNQ